VTDPDALSVTFVDRLPEGGWLSTISHTDGRTWRVTVAEREIAAARPASCGAAPTPAMAIEAVSVRARSTV
jgi:hypothetical protein